MVEDPASLVELMDSWNIAAIVNLDGLPGEDLEENVRRYDRSFPGRFATFTHPDWRQLGRLNFGARLADALGEAVDTGAKGLKVWKDLGLWLRDDEGALLLPDDERLSPLFLRAGELGVPVLIHTADPVAFFDPLSPTNERLEELLQHPDWSFADRSKFPTWERLLTCLESLVERHPSTCFIAAHAANSAEDLARLDGMLERHPNLHVDVAARIAELGRQPRAARAVIERHPDRFLFGTDAFPPTAGDYEVVLRFLETPDEHFPYCEGQPTQGRWAIYGLELPDEVLKKVESDNARRLISVAP
jgi:hypothetical protein